MRQHLDTIPIWDAYKLDSECPLCEIRARNEEGYVDNFLGASVMEPAVRVEVNRMGFCAAHLKQLYDRQNRLGLALMIDTHLGDVITRLSAHAEALNGRDGGKLGLARRNRAAKDGANPARDAARGCVICERLNDTMRRYQLTLCYLWKREAAFRDAFTESKGFCLPHYADVLEAARTELSGGELRAFNLELTRLELQNLGRVERDIEWFTQKFDYRNREASWDDSRDAVERAANKLRGKVI